VLAQALFGLFLWFRLHHAACFATPSALLFCRFPPKTRYLGTVAAATYIFDWPCPQYIFIQLTPSLDRIFPSRRPSGGYNNHLSHLGDPADSHGDSVAPRSQFRVPDFDAGLEIPGVSHPHKFQSSVGHLSAAGSAHFPSVPGHQLLTAPRGEDRQTSLGCDKYCICTCSFKNETTRKTRRTLHFLCIYLRA
jgi:hypothetical protein